VKIVEFIQSDVWWKRVTYELRTSWKVYPPPKWPILCRVGVKLHSLTQLRTVRLLVDELTTFIAYDMSIDW